MKKEYDYSGNSKSPASNLVKNIASAKKNIANTVKDYAEGYDEVQANADNPNMAKLGDAVKSIFGAGKTVLGAVSDAQQTINNPALEFHAPDKSKVTAAEKAYANAKNSQVPELSTPDKSKVTAAEKAYADAKNTPSPTFEYGDISENERYQSALSDLENIKSSEPTRTEFGSLEDYEAYKNAREAYDSAKANRPGEYQSKFDEQINSLVDQIINREKFDYNYRTDDKYAAYKKSSEEAARKAANNSMAMGARMSGGYGNSYAQNAAAQAYAEQMAGVTDKIPEFEQLAYERDRAERSDLSDNLSILNGLDSRDYTRYRNEVNDYYTDLSLLGSDVDRASNQFNADRSYHTQYEDSLMNDYNTRLAYAMQALENAENRYDNDRNFATNKWRYDVSDYNTNLDRIYNDMLYANSAYNDDRNYAINKWRYDVSDYNTNLDRMYNDMLYASSAYGDDYSRKYNEYRDKVSDRNDERNWQYQLDRDKISDARYETEYADSRADAERNWQYQLDRDKISDARYETEYADSRADAERNWQYQLDRDKANDALTERQYQDALKQQEFENGLATRSADLADREQDFNEWYKKNVLANPSPSSSSSSGSRRSSSGSSGSSSGYSSSYASDGADYASSNVMYSTSGGNVSESDIYNAAVKFVNEHPNVYLDDATVDSWGKIKNNSTGKYATGLNVPLDGKAGRVFRAYLQELGLTSRGR